MKKIKLKALLLLLGTVFWCLTSQEAQAFSPDYFTPYVAKVKGFENRLSFNNILELTKMPSNEAKDLLLKAGWKLDKESQSLVHADHYQRDSDARIYQAGFKPGTNGFRKLFIYTQPEMRYISNEFLANGYKETLVVPRKGARWTKVYTKKGFPTYSISMLLFSDMTPNAQTYNYYDYMYCLICEKP